MSLLFKFFDSAIATYHHSMFALCKGRKHTFKRWTDWN